MTHAKLFGIVLRICRERQAAEDALQDVYLTIWRRAGAFDPGRASPITWMATIARNRAIDRVRSSAIRRTEPEDAALAVADESPLAPELIAQAQTAIRLHGCLDTLEERQQAAIRTTFFDGLAYVELPIGWRCRVRPSHRASSSPSDASGPRWAPNTGTQPSSYRLARVIASSPQVFSGSENLSGGDRQ